MRPRRLELPRTNRSGRPSTTYASCGCGWRRPDRANRGVCWTHWTRWKGWMLSRLLSGPLRNLPALQRRLSHTRARGSSTSWSVPVSRGTRRSPARKAFERVRIAPDSTKSLRTPFCATVASPSWLLSGPPARFCRGRWWIVERDEVPISVTLAIRASRSSSPSGRDKRLRGGALAGGCRGRWLLSRDGDHASNSVPESLILTLDA